MQEKNNCNYSRALILMYHRIASDDFPINSFTDPYEVQVHKSNFLRQVSYLKDHFRILSLGQYVDELLSGKCADNVVVITFDDGYEDNFYHAFPILKTLAIPATIFLISGSITLREELWFDKLYGVILEEGILKLFKSKNIFEKSWYNFLLFLKSRYFIFLRNRIMKKDKETQRQIVSKLERNSSRFYRKQHIPVRLLTWDQIREMDRYGIEFGVHTCSHPVLARLSEEAAFKEIQNSKKEIELKLGKTSDLFAYPYGSFDTFTTSTKNMLINLGFRAACTTNIGNNTLRSNPFELKRIPIRNWNFEKFVENINKYLQ